MLALSKYSDHFKPELVMLECWGDIILSPGKNHVVYKLSFTVQWVETTKKLIKFSGLKMQQLSF